MSNSPIRAIANPALWAASPELPRVAWKTATYLAAPQALLFTSPPQPGRRTQCQKGHPYNEENTYTHPTYGSRICRICRRENARRYYDNQYRALGIERPAPQPTPPAPAPPRAPREPKPVGRSPQAAPGGNMESRMGRPSPPEDSDLARAKARIAARRQRREGVA